MSTFSSTTPPTELELKTASEILLKDENGNSIKLGDLYKDQTTILIFIRHFSCGLCQDYVSYLQTKITPEMLSKKNAKIVVIGCGDYTVIKPYKALLQSTFPMYADSKRKSYIALGMTRRTLDGGDAAPEYQVRSIIGNIANSIVNIFKMGSFTGNGDIKALGGEFVIEKLAAGESKVVYTHRMENTRGHGVVSDLIAAAGL